MKTGCTKPSLSLPEAKKQVEQLHQCERACEWHWEFCYECEAFHVYWKKKY